MLGLKRGHSIDRYISNYVVFDLETTGTSCQVDKVVEISAIRVADGKITDEFTTLVNPECSIPYGASRVNGITDEMVQDAPLFADAAAEFLRFAGDEVLVGHNIQSFDMNFIYRDCEAYFGQVPDNDFVDTLKLARRCLPLLQRYRLTDLAAYYGVSAKGAHRALQDCRINQLVYERLGKDLERVSAALRRCPLCGQPLYKRKGKYGYFMGCGGYPQCRYTENL